MRKEIKFSQTDLVLPFGSETSGSKEGLGPKEVCGYKRIVNTPPKAEMVDLQSLPQWKQGVMMNEQENVQVVQQMFTAFGQRDLPTVLNILTDDVVWQSPVRRIQGGEISWAKPRRGREEVATFFKELFEKVQPERMETLEFTAQADRVVVEGKNRGTVKSTGRTYEHDWVMVVTLRQGKIVRVRHYYDTHDIIVAFHNK